MVLQYSKRLSRVLFYYSNKNVLIYRALTFLGQPFQVVNITYNDFPYSFSLATTNEISFDFFSLN